MEHLTHQPLARTFRAEIRDAARPLEVRDWSSKDHEYGTCPPVYPRIRWLGHRHEDSSYLHGIDPDPQPMSAVFLNLYGPDWDIDSPIKSQDLRYMHPSLSALEDTDVFPRIAAFVQAWLFFGLLEAISERPISVSYLVRLGEDSIEWLYTRNLPALLEAWIRQLSSLDDEVRDSKLRQARACAIRANSILADLLFKIEGNATSTLYLEFRQILLSVEPALSALHEAIVSRIDFHFRTEIRSFGAVDYPFPRGYSEKLVRKGWCPFVVASAEIAMSPSFLRYVDAAGYAQTNGGHGRCTSDACERNQIDPDTYVQLHCQPKCRCCFIKPNIKAIFEILDADLIPVVQFCSEKARFELGAVAPNDTGTDYIAFSHVWADGLGSCTEKGLRTCQARRLHRLAQKELTHGSWFWIDGLCVPKREPYRGKAIQMMKLTYRNATGVVVLDSSLHRISKSSSIIEIGWTLFASGWMGRLWTYQEGFLPPWVHLELNDGLYNLYELIQQLYKIYYNHSSNPFPFIFTRDLLAALQKTRPLDRYHHTRSKSHKIVDTFNVLTRRLTSRPDDQILVLGLMLDIDVEYLITLTGEVRWREFYLSLKEVPWTMVFDRRPKMSLPPFRWAPKTWISHGKDEWLHYDDVLAACSHDGLRVNITALILHEECSFGEFEILIQVDKDLYELSRLTSSLISSRTFNIIFVRYFKHETPQMSLERNSSVLVGVGVGFINFTTCDQLQYDFAGEWNIQLLMRPPENQSLGLKMVTGEWEERQFLFT